MCFDSKCIVKYMFKQNLVEIFFKVNLNKLKRKQNRQILWMNVILIWNINKIMEAYF